MTDNKDVLIVGIGNTLLQDEGVGVYIAKKLSRSNSLDNLAIIDCCSDILRLTSYSDVYYNKIIIIDAIQAGGAAGEIYRFEISDINEIDPIVSSVHMIGAITNLKLVIKLFPNIKRSKIILIGIEPETIDIGIGLSKIVSSQIDNLVNTVYEELEKQSNG